MQLRKIILAFVITLLTALTTTKGLGQSLSSDIRLFLINQDTFVCVAADHNAATIDYWAWKGVFSVDALSRADSVISNLNSQVGASMNNSHQLTELVESLNIQLVASNNSNTIMKQRNDVLNAAVERISGERNQLTLDNKALEKNLKRQKWKKWEWILVGVGAGFLVASL